MEKVHHPKAYVDTYLPRTLGGRGLTKLELNFKIHTIGLDAYLTQSIDQLVKIAKQHESRKMYSISTVAAKFKNELDALKSCQQKMRRLPSSPNV